MEILISRENEGYSKARRTESSLNFWRPFRAVHSRSDGDTAGVDAVDHGLAVQGVDGAVRGGELGGPRGARRSVENVSVT